jgi:hypothetical protein
MTRFPRSAFLLATLASISFAQTLPCPDTATGEVRPQPLQYPMISDRYSVQYSFDNGSTWKDAKVYISYYGGTLASPWLPYSPYSLPYQGTSGPIPPVKPSWETSMSFVSITIPELGGRTIPKVLLAVSDLHFGAFVPTQPISVRPTAKGIVPFVSGGRAMFSRTMAPGGEQFVLWWKPGTPGATVGGGVEALAIFLNPEYLEPTGSKVFKVMPATDLTTIPSTFDTLDFEGTYTIGNTGNTAYVVPTNIKNIYLGADAWVQAKLRFAESGYGDTRRVYGPGVLDVSRFDYDLRHATGASGSPPECTADQGYPAISFEATHNALPSGTPGIRDQYSSPGSSFPTPTSMPPTFWKTPR